MSARRSLTRGIGEQLRLLDPGLSDLVRTPHYADAAEKAQYTPLVKIDGPVDKAPMNPGEFALCAPGTNHWFAGQETLVGEKVIEWLTKT